MQVILWITIIIFAIILGVAVTPAYGPMWWALGLLFIVNGAIEREIGKGSK